MGQYMVGRTGYWRARCAVAGSMGRAGGRWRVWPHSGQRSEVRLMRRWSQLGQWGSKSLMENWRRQWWQAGSSKLRRWAVPQTGQVRWRVEMFSGEVGWVRARCMARAMRKARVDPRARQAATAV